jgi:hypothetical protein
MEVECDYVVVAAVKAADEGENTVPSGLTPVQHLGWIFLDESKGISYVTHMVTNERINLPKGEWELEYDDDGMAAVCGVRDNGTEEGEPAHFVVNELFTTQLLNGDHGFYLSSEDSTKSLSDLQGRFRDATATLTIAPTNAKTAVHAFVFRRARACKMRVFWGLHQFFTLLRMQGYASKPSNWVSHRLHTFERTVQEVYGIGHVVHSTHGNLGQKHAAQPWPTRCLPALAISSCAMLLLLHRWAYADTAMNGLSEKQGDARDAAVCVFRSFISYAVAEQTEEVEFPIQINKDWTCSWPRPQSDNYRTVRILLVDGLLDFSDLKSVLTARSSKAWQKKWWESIEQCFEGVDGFQIGIHDFLAMAGSASIKRLLAQIMNGIALLLEVRLAKNAASEADNADDRLDFALKTFDDTLDANEDRSLAAYLLSGVQASANQKYYSLGTDKGNNTGLPLQNTAIGFCSNELIICCPVVGGIDRQTRNEQMLKYIGIAFYTV